MSYLMALAALLGLFVEERVPATGYACLSVKYKGVVYKAERLERSRLTGSVSLRLPAPFDPVAGLLGQSVKGRVVQLGGYDVVVDSTTCSCQPLASANGTCLDK